MDINDLKISLIDFSGLSRPHWFFRRFVIGSILFTYMLYAIAFFFQLALPEYDLFEFSSDGTLPPIPDAITVATFGFIGGVFFGARTFIRTTQRRADAQLYRFDLPISWYLLRPMLGSLTAIFLYYTILAGQVVFFVTDGTQQTESVNIYTISLLAIIAGTFTEEAFAKLYSVAKNAFKVDAEKSDKS